MACAAAIEPSRPEFCPARNETTNLRCVLGVLCVSALIFVFPRYEQITVERH